MGAYHQLYVVICSEEQRHRVSFDAAAVDGSVHGRLEYVIYAARTAVRAVNSLGEL